jgi:ATP-binding protein involved in chromosome partitioning
MAVDKERVLAELRRVKGPDMTGNIVDLGLVSEVLVKDDRVYFSITVPPERAEELEPLRQAAEKVVKEMTGVKAASVVLTADRQRGAGQGGGNGRAAVTGGHAPESARVRQARAAAGGAPPAAGGHPHTASQTVDGIRHMIAVASGKGGVGKSTTTVNLALGLQSLGLKVGILDADIYGPSQPRLLGLTGKPEVKANDVLLPMRAYGLQVMSMGFMIDEATPVIWRGPMVVSALTQMLRGVAWTEGVGELDVLVIDMPPGTGDVQLSMAQQVPLSGAIIVSTPQDLALIDARKGLAMFRKTDVPVLGIIENMSYFVCSKCGERHEIFGHGGAEAEAEALGVPFLGAVPLDLEIRLRSDAGTPIVATLPESPHAAAYREIAAKAWAEIEAADGKRPTPPRLEVASGGSALRVTFDDRTHYELTAEMLRVMSPSAEVQGHSPEQRVTVAGKRNVRIRALEPVGNYAVKIVFDDGHATGLFSWTYLATLGREKEKRWNEYLAELAQKGASRG